MAKKQKKKILPKKKNGRPSKISTIDLGLLERLAEQGLTDKQMAKVLNITERTLNNYKKKDKKFFHSLKKGKLNPNEQVKQSLFKRANGFEYTETTYERIKIGKAKTPALKVKEVVKLVIPDVLAQIFWLTNREPDEWKHRQQLEHIGEIKVPVTIVNKIPKHFNKGRGV